MMRFLFLVLFLVGGGVAFAYPWVMRNSSGHEIGSWRVQDTASGFLAVDVPLTSADAPVKIVLDATAAVPAVFDPTQIVLTITASSAGKTLLARRLSLDGAETREDSPQTLQHIHRIQAGTIPEVQDGTFTFTVGPGDAEGVEMLAVDLLLEGGGKQSDPRAQPIGFSIMAIGFIGFVLSFRRGPRDGSGTPTAPPTRPRWGRDAASP